MTEDEKDPEPATTVFRRQAAEEPRTVLHLGAPPVAGQKPVLPAPAPAQPEPNSQSSWQAAPVQAAQRSPSPGEATRLEIDVAAILRNTPEPRTSPGFAVQELAHAPPAQPAYGPQAQPAYAPPAQPAYAPQAQPAYAPQAPQAYAPPAPQAYAPPAPQAYAPPAPQAYAPAAPEPPPAPLHAPAPAPASITPKPILRTATTPPAQPKVAFPPMSPFNPAPEPTAPAQAPAVAPSAPVAPTTPSPLPLPLASPEPPRARADDEAPMRQTRTRLQSPVLREGPALTSTRLSPPPGNDLAKPRGDDLDATERKLRAQGGVRPIVWLSAVAVVLIGIVGGRAVLRNRASGKAVAAATAPATTQPATVEAPAPQPGAPSAATELAALPSEPVKPAPEPAPTEQSAQAEAPAPRAPTEPQAAKLEPPQQRGTPASPASKATAAQAASPAAQTLADLEKRALDRLVENDHQAARGLYRELAKAMPDRKAYGLMAQLLERKLGQQAAERGQP